ncbi:MAG: TRAP transporter small permease [Rhodobacteraceae bacterium]|nr:TRAP transporter small permease [Paracoccaceae bacterium]
MNASFQQFGGLARTWLDRLYLACGIIAAGSLILILVLVTLQMAARWIGEIFPGSSDYAGYFMASSTFFAFAYALNNGSHIRVNILLNALGRYRRWLEVWCFGIASALSVFWSYYAIKSVVWSRKLGDISQGLDATPLWIPQLAMAAGSCVFAIALIDNLVRVLLFGSHSAEARSVGDLDS